MMHGPLCVRLCTFIAVCACRSMQRLIHNDDRKYSIISSHSVIFTKQQGGERGAGGERWEREMGERQSDGRLKELKVDGDKDRQRWKLEDEVHIGR